MASQAWAPTQHAFDAVLATLRSPSTLALFDPFGKFPLIIETDASNVGIGAVLSQHGSDGVLRPLAFLSKKLANAERNYTTTEKELLAIVFAAMRCRPYLTGNSVHVFTDHAALRYILGAKDLTGRLARWTVALSCFNLTISSEADNLADALIWPKNEFGQDGD